MIPWLVIQGVLALVLASLALYYLVLFPHSECHPSHISAAAGTFDGPPSWQFSVECNVLLWHSVVMLLSVLILFYYFYIVHEFAAQLKIETKVLDGLSVMDVKTEEKKEGVAVTKEEGDKVEEEGETKPKPEKRRVRIQEP